MATDLGFPLSFDAQGRTRTVPLADWVRGLVEQVLFTSPGERVMRPTFGSGLGQLVFAPGSPELATTVQALAQGALQQHLGDLVVIDEVSATMVDATLSVTVRYTLRATGEPQQATLVREGVAP